MKFCSEDGSTACKSTVPYPVCGAAAGDDEQAVGGFGDTKKEASANAMAKCGADTCKIIVTDGN